MRDGFSHSLLFVYCLRILCFGYNLRYANERTNERTNERNYGVRGGFVKHLGHLCALFYIVLRKKCNFTERNTVCAAALFHVKSVAQVRGFINLYFVLSAPIIKTEVEYEKKF